MNLPARLCDTYEFLACLYDAPRRKTLLLREKQTEKRFILKCSDQAETLKNEYALSRQVAGLGIPECVCFFEEEGRGYLLRAYIPGCTLEEKIAAHGPYAPEEAVALTQRLLTILQRFHAQRPPLIHRDIKAENILMTEGGELYLIDLDIARVYDEEAVRDTRVLGTPEVAPPEQFGYCQTDTRSDIYAVGMLLRFLLTGAVQQHGSVADRWLEKIIRRCTAFSPDARYADAAALAEALTRWSRLHRRRRWLLPLLTLTVCAVLLLGIQSEESSKYYHFREPLIGEAAALQLGKDAEHITPEELTELTILVLAGDTPLQSWDELLFYSGELQTQSTTITTRGTVTSLDDLAQMPKLETLVLCNQQLTDLSPLAGLPLRRLDVHGNQLTDLSPLTNCASLTELRVSGNPLTDLAPLVDCTSLSMLNVSRAQVRSLRPLAALPHLQTLYLLDCPLVTELNTLPSTVLGLSLWPCSAEQLEAIGSMAQLRWLSLWNPEGMTDLTTLSRLTYLEGLFLDASALTSLNGIASMTSLQRLEILSAKALDLSLLPEAKRLTNLFVDDTIPISEENLQAVPHLAIYRNGTQINSGEGH